MRLRSSSLVVLLALSTGSAFAQTPPAVESAPLAAPATPAPAPAAAPAQAATPPATPAPAAEHPAQQPPVTQAQTPPSPAPAAPAAPAQPQPPVTAQPTPAPAAPASPAPAPVTAAPSTLFPGPGDPTNVEEGVLVAKPSAILSGTVTWEEGFNTLKNAFRKIEDELKKAGVAPSGRPVTVFVHTDDKGFRFDAMIPVAQVPEGKSELTPDIKFGKTPEGKAFRFVHKDAYEEIDGTYETITAYLDAKDIVSKDAFIEEYVSELTDSADTNLEVNIYVQPKE
ncbi:GyrI-like domain-containing protein [Microvirga alba]|uniref:GyrI-like domain-containing protein n=1 Tax=Microvirga alba TaxID=2791025 RepID=A0A931BQQ8_9HYPH|nr:GyrI-like domain-containing protein [Microvirga alba]MBF9233039.1 GyrI-like domain-containing protein [Microvirga alba]